MASSVSMANTNCDGGDEVVLVDESNPMVARLRQLMSGDAAVGWNRCWEEGATPWDLGQPTPAVVKLVQSGTLPSGRALVPGCGAGYDVVAFSSPERFVVGLDVSDVAVQKARERSSSVPNANFFTFVAADFFAWKPPELFDLIFDYAFFCALNPSLRSAWAKRMGELLKPDGELITLICLVKDQEAGPPFNTTLADYEDVLKPVGFQIVSIQENDVAVQTRKGLEKVARWKRMRN